VEQVEESVSDPMKYIYNIYSWSISLAESI